MIKTARGGTCDHYHVDLSGQGGLNQIACAGRCASVCSFGSDAPPSFSSLMCSD